MMAWLDGEFVTTARLPRPDPDVIAPFETMGAKAAQVPLWDRHLQRLANAAQRAGLVVGDRSPDDGDWPTADWRAAAGELLVQTGNTDGVLRLALLPVGDRTHVAMTTRPRSPASRVSLLPTVVERTGAIPPADLKGQPRTFYDQVLQQAQDGGADDGIVVASDGAVLETAVANLWLRLDGRWVTPPLDGRVLPGIARQVLLERDGGKLLEERAVDLGDVHRAEALATSNAVYGPRAAALLDAGPPDRELVDRELGALWRAS